MLGRGGEGLIPGIVSNAGEQDISSFQLFCFGMAGRQPAFGGKSDQNREVRSRVLGIPYNLVCRFLFYSDRILHDAPKVN